MDRNQARHRIFAPLQKSHARRFPGFQSCPKRERPGGPCLGTALVLNLELVEKPEEPLADARGSESRPRVSKQLLSRDREGAVARSSFSTSSIRGWLGSVEAFVTDDKLSLRSLEEIMQPA